MATLVGEKSMAVELKNVVSMNNGGDGISIDAGANVTVDGAVTAGNAGGGIVIRRPELMEFLRIPDTAEERRALAELLQQLQGVEAGKRPYWADKVAKARDWIRTGADVSRIVDLANRTDVAEFIRSLMS